MASPPSWLADMANLIAAEIQPTDILSPIGCHYYFNDDVGHWEVSIFAANTEAVGGSRDGVMSPSRFTIDLQRITLVFDEVTAFNWQAVSLGPDDELGPHISLEGIYHGESIWLRVLSHAPERFGSGRYANAYDSRLEDIW